MTGPTTVEIEQKTAKADAIEAEIERLHDELQTLVDAGMERITPLLDAKDSPQVLVDCVVEALVWVGWSTLVRVNAVLEDNEPQSIERNREVLGAFLQTNLRYIADEFALGGRAVIYTQNPSNPGKIQ